MKTKTTTTTIATAMIALGLTACLSEEGRDVLGDDRAVQSSKVAMDILEWAGQEAASFVIGEIFGLALPPDAADLSAEAIEEIRNIVAEEVREGALTERSGEVTSLVNTYNAYSRPACDLGLTDEGECSVTALDGDYEEAWTIAVEADRLHQIYVSWVTNTEQLGTDDNWKVFLAGPVKLTSVIDIALKRHMYEIERLKGYHHDTNAREALSALTGAAVRYGALFGEIETTYDDIVGKFGDPYTKNFGTGTNKRFKGCFEPPNGIEKCSESERTQQCTNSLGGSYCTDWEGPDFDELIAEATELRQKQMNTFEQLVIESQGNLYEMHAEMDTIAALEHIPPTPPNTCRRIRVESEEFSAFDEDGATGGYTRDDDQIFNGFPVYVDDNDDGMTYRIYRRVVPNSDGSDGSEGRWYLVWGEGDLHEAHSGAVDFSLTAEDEPWKAEWSKSTVTCYESE